MIMGVGYHPMQTVVNAIGQGNGSLLLTPIVQMVANPEMTLLILLLIPVGWIVRRRFNEIVPGWKISTRGTS